MRVRRALLFMPGDDRRKIEKGAGLNADSIIMDLEDGVALNNKAAARSTIAAALRDAAAGSLNFGRTEKLVRINAVSRQFFPADDLDAALSAPVDGIVIPKVEHSWQITQVSERITAAERAHGWEEGTVEILAILETAMGILNAREIAENSPRLTALCFGAEDLAGDLGAVRSASMIEVAYARSAVVLHAKAFGLDAVDTPYVDLNNLDGLTAEAIQAAHMGFTGKLAIHPKQVDPIQAAFTPSDAQIEHALALIKAHDDAQASGIGTFAYEGKMVDMPVIRAAEAIIKRARAAGKLPR